MNKGTWKLKTRHPSGKDGGQRMMGCKRRTIGKECYCYFAMMKGALATAAALTHTLA